MPFDDVTNLVTKDSRKSTVKVLLGVTHVAIVFELSVQSSRYKDLAAWQSKRVNRLRCIEEVKLKGIGDSAVGCFIRFIQPGDELFPMRSTWAVACRLVERSPMELTDCKPSLISSSIVMSTRCVFPVTGLICPFP